MSYTVLQPSYRKYGKDSVNLSTLFLRLRYPPENVSTFEKIVSAGSPTAISIDQINEHLYWTDSYAFGRIGRCNFDGTNIVTIISERDVWGLAIDPTHRYVFNYVR